MKKFERVMIGMLFIITQITVWLTASGIVMQPNDFGDQIGFVIGTIFSHFGIGMIGVYIIGTVIREAAE